MYNFDNDCNISSSRSRDSLLRTKCNRPSAASRANPRLPSILFRPEAHAGLRNTAMSFSTPRRKRSAISRHGRCIEFRGGAGTMQEGSMQRNPVRRRRERWQKTAAYHRRNVASAFCSRPAYPHSQKIARACRSTTRTSTPAAISRPTSVATSRPNPLDASTIRQATPACRTC